MNTVAKTAITVSFALSLTLPGLAQQCPTGSFHSPNGSMQRFTNPGTSACRTSVPNCPVTTVTPSGPRPTRTSEGVPVRYVDVQVPNYAQCQGRNGLGYGYGYGPNGFGYGYGYGGFNYSQPSASASTAPRQRQAARRDVPKSAPAPDPRTAATHQMRKALDKFARENSVGGKIYLRDGSTKWLLSYNGQPTFDNGLAVIPCRGREGKGQIQDVTLTLSISDGEVTTVELTHQSS